ncbi:MAG: DUF4271 domain-containing protein [Hymenobacteraceae bacterium]|nr:DUF4271 domain-containing protein [Hymenobacteraceae bacterium]MDX5394687.1 DUF4271 domain-containing protein [Hymenobacteraceae bacterium]MDX5510718.1 DUF4271 domain-containing protein [Hymenobacteraceae bacterium]
MLVGLALFAATGAFAQGYEPLDVRYKNSLSSEWLILDEEENKLIPYVPELHEEKQAFYQWVEVRKGQPFPVTFTAKKDLSIFIDNKLIFIADSTSNYQLDLLDLFQPEKPIERHLLSVWHPADLPNINSFKNLLPEIEDDPSDADFVQRRVLEDFSQNAFIIFLLLIGIMYGGLKTSYTSDFHSVFRISTFLRTSALEEGFLSRPISSLSSILFVIAFSLSFALLIVAIHTNIQNIFIFNRLFKVTEADITTKVLFYTFVVFAFIILKYLYLHIMAYIFDLVPLVAIQYREFIRTTLFMGMFLPVIMLLYLALNNTMPTTVLFISNIAVSVILIFTAIRIFYTINNRVSLQNLHLFSYLCATEIIPLAILLKLIVFNY